MSPPRHDAQRVLIADTTIRDEHLPVRNALPPRERAAAAGQIGALGVDVIEAGFGDSAGTLAPLHAIASEFQDGGPAISGLVRTLGDEQSLTDTYQAISVAARPRLHLHTAAVDLVDPSGRFRADPRRLLDRARAAVARARDLTDDVEFSPPRTEADAIEIAAEWAEAAIEEGARTVNIRTIGKYADPAGFREVLEELIRLTPSSGSVVLSADPFVPHLRGGEAATMALESAVAALDAGCRQLKCALNGIAATPGHAPLELIALDIWEQGQLGGSRLETGLDIARILATGDAVAAAKDSWPRPSAATTPPAAPPAPPPCARPGRGCDRGGRRRGHCS